MENEFNILNNIDKNKNATQREIAKSTGMSLGNVNILIKRLIRKGLLKMEKLNPKTIRYILTPEGLKEKADLTYKYFVISYKYINEINTRIDRVFTENRLKECGCIVFGENDEVFQMIENNLKQKGVDFKHIVNIEKLKAFLGEASNSILSGRVIISWGNTYIALLNELKLQYINLLENK